MSCYAEKATVIGCPVSKFESDSLCAFSSRFFFKRAKWPVSSFAFRPMSDSNEFLVKLDLGSKGNSKTGLLETLLSDELTTGKIEGIAASKGGPKWWRVISGAGKKREAGRKIAKLQRMREKIATQFARAEHYLRRGRVTSHNSITFSSVAPIFFSRPKIEEGVGVPLTDKTPKKKKETEETCMRELKKSLPYDIACQPFDITPSQQSKVGQKLRR